jgi:hypothetical protein
MRTFSAFFRLLKLGSCLFLLSAIPSLARAQSFPPAWSSSATYTAGDIVQYGGNWYRAMIALSAGGPYPAAAYGKWELNFVRSNTTLTIGAKQGFANLVYAWQFARNARIADAAYLHLDIVTTSGAFSETFTSAFSLDHSFGALISIIGDNPNNISLSFTGASSNGFTIDTGHTIGLVDNLVLFGNGSSGSGILVGSGAEFNGEDLDVNSFSVGLYVWTGGNAQITGANLAHTSRAVYVAQATCYLPTLTIQYCGNVGIYGAMGANVRADEASITSSGEDPVQGIYATDGATVYAPGSTISGFGYGCFATERGYIDVFSGTFSGNNNQDAYAQYGGEVFALGATTPDGTSTDSSFGSVVIT